MTDWTDKEARKLRIKINGWINARIRELQSLSGPSDSAYADALGLPYKEATARVKAQEAHLDAFANEVKAAPLRPANEVKAAPLRPVIDARGPTDWNRKGPDGKTGKALRSRILRGIDAATARGSLASYAQPGVSQEARYGEAMGWTPDQTAGAINRHREHLAAFAWQGVRK